MREVRLWMMVIALLTTSVSIGSAAQESTQDFVQRVTQAVRLQRTLSADIVLTWKTRSGTKTSKGTVHLMKPNYALIKLAGDYPLHVLVSDGTARYSAPDDKSYTRE